MNAMRKVYFAGDFISNTGPAIVNKSYYRYINNSVHICKSSRKLIRLIHFTIYLLLSRAILVSGFSLINIRLVKLGKLFGLPTYYLMHGYIKLESRLNEVPYSGDKARAESELLANVDTIICVSENFCNYLKKELPNLSNKITYVSNGVHKQKKQIINLDKPRSVFNILSIGGGMPRKNNLQICRAIELIGDDSICFTVIGPKHRDGDLIASYSFVNYIDSANHDEVLKQMKNSHLYIQNSSFETFGLAVCEAIGQGCDVLLSKQIGAISIIDNLYSNSIINNNDDIDDISRKIKYKMYHKSNASINAESNSWHCSSKKLIRIAGGSDDRG